MIRRFSLEPPPPRWLWLLSLAVRVAALPWCVMIERRGR